jgi:hypothetical protein
MGPRPIEVGPQWHPSLIQPGGHGMILQKPDCQSLPILIFGPQPRSGETLGSAWNGRIPKRTFRNLARAMGLPV